MAKLAHSFRFHPVTMEHIGTLQELTGSSQVAVVEQAVAVYRALLTEGIRAAERKIESSERSEVSEASSRPGTSASVPQSATRKEKTKAAKKRRSKAKRDPAVPEREKKVPQNAVQQGTLGLS